MTEMISENRKQSFEQTHNNNNRSNNRSYDGSGNYRVTGANN